MADPSTSFTSANLSNAAEGATTAATALAVDSERAGQATTTSSTTPTNLTTTVRRTSRLHRAPTLFGAENPSSTPKKQNKPKKQTTLKNPSTPEKQLASQIKPTPKSSAKKLKVKMQIERKVKLVTEQHNIPKDSPVAEFPMKEWSVQIYLLDQDGHEHAANCFTKVTYNLHPSFENPNQTFHEPPFTCKNEGWGEFEMSIDMFTTEKGGKQTVFHDLNFQSATYDNVQTIVFKNPSQSLLSILRETGPISEEDPKAAKVRKANDGKKRKPQYDYEKMADALTKLGEDDLLHVIQLIHDHKSDDTYTKNDLDAGEFSVDLYTLGDELSKMIWQFLMDQKMVS